VDLAVIWIYFSHDFSSLLIQNREHALRLFSEPDCDLGLLVAQVHEVDLNRLLVVLAHLLDARLINVRLIVIGEGAQESGELASNEQGDIVLGNPSGQVLVLLVAVVIHLRHVDLVPVVHQSMSTCAPPCLGQLVVTKVVEGGSLADLATRLELALSVQILISLAALLCSQKSLLLVVDAI